MIQIFFMTQYLLIIFKYFKYINTQQPLFYLYVYQINLVNEIFYLYYLK
jgi:hypothetical protein